MNFTRDTVTLHPGSYVHRVSKQAITRHLFSNNSSQDRTCMDPNSNLHKDIKHTPPNVTCYLTSFLMLSSHLKVHPTTTWDTSKISNIHRERLLVKVPMWTLPKVTEESEEAL